MPWAPGQSGNPATQFGKGVTGNPQGRPKRLTKRVDQVLSEKGIDPTAEILKLLESTELKPAEKLRGWLELLSYCLAKPKEIDLAITEMPGQLTPEQIEWLKAKARERAA